MANEPDIPIINFAGHDETALAARISAACLDSGFSIW
jgi:hypothetical protein